MNGSVQIRGSMREMERKAKAPLSNILLRIWPFFRAPNSRGVSETKHAASMQQASARTNTYKHTGDHRDASSRFLPQERVATKKIGITLRVAGGA